MADNVGITPGTGATAAADDIGGVLYQRVKITTGTDGVSDGDVSSANPMPVEIPGVTSDAPLPVRLDQGPEAIISNNGSLQIDSTQVNEQSAESLNAPNFALRGDEPVQMVGLHPSYPIPIDTATPMPVAGRDPTGAQRQIAVNSDGIVRTTVYDSPNIVFSNDRITGTGFSPVFSLDGYGTISVNLFLASGGGCRIQQSNDLVSWVDGVTCWNWGPSGTVSLGSNGNLGASGLWTIPAVAKYARFFWASNPGLITASVTLRAVPPTFLGLTPSTNITQIAGLNVATNVAQLGANVFGSVAVGSAHGAVQPVNIAGSDGTNVRRILTDTSGNTRVVGPLAAGTSLISPTNAAFAPNLMGISDLEGKVQRATGDVRGRQAVTLPDATAADDGIIDALNNVVRELKLLNAKITDLPYWLGINSVMPDDGQSFRDDPTLFNR